MKIIKTVVVVVEVDYYLIFSYGHIVQLVCADLSHDVVLFFWTNSWMLFRTIVDHEKPNQGPDKATRSGKIEYLKKLWVLKYIHSAQFV